MLNCLCDDVQQPLKQLGDAAAVKLSAELSSSGLFLPDLRRYYDATDSYPLARSFADPRYVDNHLSSSRVRGRPIEALLRFLEIFNRCFQNLILCFPSIRLPEIFKEVWHVVSLKSGKIIPEILVQQSGATEFTWNGVLSATEVQFEELLTRPADPLHHLVSSVVYLDIVCNEVLTKRNE